LNSRDLQRAPDGETSAAVRARVGRAREVQRRRFSALSGVNCNAQLRGEALRELCGTTAGARAVLGGWLDMKRLSARAHDRVLKVARTIADLDGSALVHEAQIGEALQLRCLDRPTEGPPPRVSTLTIARHAALHKSPGTPPGG